MSTRLPRLILGLVGPCGSGKSTLAAAFARLPGVDVVHESAPGALDSADRYRDLDIPNLQRCFLETRLKQVRAATSPVVVLDRTVDEDRHVFLTLHHELGGLTDRERISLDRLAQHTAVAIGYPAATVAVRADPEVLRRRIGFGARPAWLEASFERQLELYANLLGGIHGPIVEIDTTHVSLESFGAIAAWIAGTAPSAVHGVPCVSPGLSLRWSFR